MSRIVGSTRSSTDEEASRSLAQAVALGDRDDFVIDLRDGRRRRSYLRDHQVVDSAASRKLRSARRVFDVAASVVGVAVCAPIFVAAAVAARLGSPGPVFFVQERVGHNGKIFRCYKFRSMHVDAELRLDQLLHSDSTFRDAWMRDQKVRQDPRVTRAGRLLRKTSLDELPQLLNVIKGDMSLVGPRPVVPEETVRYGDAMPTVLSVRPGITGLWQVSGRNNLPYPERVELDLRYVEEQSIALDAKILVRTVTSVATGHGAS